MIIIDATDLILGRLASAVAKHAMLGEDVTVINCSNAIISGSKNVVLKTYVRKRERGTPTTGPFIHRGPEQIVRRAVRGMLPYKQERGLAAYRRIRCYRGVPDSIKGEKPISIKSANVSKLPNLKYIQLKTLSQRLGAKIE
jgi:large subunit ribosomal protein L13